MKKKILIVASLMTALILSACGTDAKKEKGAKEGLQIVTTFYPMYDFTKEIVGDKGKVSLLITGDTEPHDYEPSAKDVAKIQDADVFVYNSADMEAWVKNVLESIDLEKTTVIEASEGISLLEGHEEESEADHEGHDHDHETDPHVWLDPVLANKEVATITKGIIAADEANKVSYEANSAKFSEALEQLNLDYEAAFKGAKQREFVTQHAAFSYLAARYELTQVPIAGISPEQEPSPASLAKIEDFVRKHDVKTIYTEELSSNKIAETIANATGAEMAVLDTLEGLSNQRQEEGDTYLSVMKANLMALQKTIK